MPHIISKPKPDNSNATGLNQKYGFGYFETTNYPFRRTQEDALAWHVLSQKELNPTSTSAPLTPTEIGHRLWTSYQSLDTPDLTSGTTASTTIYDGKGNFVTATLADAVSFAVVYNRDGDALGVIRLNSVTHKPTNTDEMKRIEQAGGQVFVGRVNGVLAVSRAIGDNEFGLKMGGVCSEATIDITSVDKIVKDLAIDSKAIGSIQIITACDGFTDGAGHDQSKKNHEKYLFNILKEIKSPGELPQDTLSKLLAQRAVENRSADNVSVAVQTITNQTPPLLLGIYDGHNGSIASCKVADNIGRVFKEQCALTPQEYAQQELSVVKKKVAYKRDNNDKHFAANIQPNGPIFHKDPRIEKELLATVNDLLKLTSEYRKSLNNLDPDVRLYRPITKKLMDILNSSKSNEDKIKEFYTYLDQPHQFKLQPPGKNIDIIKRDTTPNARNYLLGIAIIAATVLTGVLPGLLIIGIVYAATGKHPFDLFQSNGERFEKETNIIKDKAALTPSFFKPAPSSPQQEADDAQLNPEIKPQ